MLGPELVCGSVYEGCYSVSLKVGKGGQLDDMGQNFKCAYLLFHFQNFSFQKINFNLKSFLSLSKFCVIFTFRKFP